MILFLLLHLHTMWCGQCCQCFRCIFFDPEAGGNMYLWSNGSTVHIHTARWSKCKINVTALAAYRDSAHYHRSISKLYLCYLSKEMSCDEIKARCKLLDFHDNDFKTWFSDLWDHVVFLNYPIQILRWPWKAPHSVPLSLWIQRYVPGKVHSFLLVCFPHLRCTVHFFSSLPNV